MRRYNAPPSIVLAAHVYAEEFQNALDRGCGEIVVNYAVVKTARRTGLPEGKVKLCSRLAMEILRDADTEYFAEYRARHREIYGEESNVRTGVPGRPLRVLRG